MHLHTQVNHTYMHTYAHTDTCHKRNRKRKKVRLLFVLNIY